MKFHSKFAAAAILAALALVAPASAAYVQVHITHVPYGAVKAVIPVTAVNPKVWNVKLHNLLNAENAIKAGNGTLQARVVLYARGIAMLQQPMAPASSNWWMPCARMACSSRFATIPSKNCKSIGIRFMASKSPMLCRPVFSKLHGWLTMAGRWIR